ncbi:CstA-like transporter-associated (seleno)protein [Brevibacillus daliensis]|uniref:CstA-like transporter-associated (seleno)protein n=1 Tax=Brevibacillus daliensis TaxID=2892995 RepID=UPI001E4374DF|nr:YbdD/YjiX family protein [Brevibacillus daliensis]
MRRKVRAFRKKWRKVSSAIKTIFGMPDYDRYLEHWYRTHGAPGKFPMSEKEYYMFALKNRYESGTINRCC